MKFSGFLFRKHGNPKWVCCPTHGHKRSLSATSSHPLSHKTARFGIPLIPQARRNLRILPPEIKGCGIGVLAMEAAAAHAWRNPFCAKIQPPTAASPQPWRHWFLKWQKEPQRMSGQEEGGREDKKRRGSSTLGCHHLSRTWGERTYFNYHF